MREGAGRGIRSRGMIGLMFKNRGWGLILMAGLVCLAGEIRAEEAGKMQAANLTSAQIVERMQVRSQAQLDALKHYEALRHYAVEYRGFSRYISARMDVRVTYNAGAGKSFQIVSQSGSKLLCEKVLKRAVDSEKEASEDRAATALTPANYNFSLAGSEELGGRRTYILNVEPIAPSKFLYRGKVWVDAADFAVVKIEAEPAKSPSFWISKTSILAMHGKTGDFWLPTENRSETRVRVGGTAVFTIDYGSYQVEPGGVRQVAAGQGGRGQD